MDDSDAMEPPTTRDGKNIIKVLEILNEYKDEPSISRNKLKSICLVKNKKEIGKKQLSNYLRTLYRFHAIEFKDKKDGREDYPRIVISDIGRAMLSGAYVEGDIMIMPQEDIQRIEIFLRALHQYNSEIFLCEDPELLGGPRETWFDSYNDVNKDLQDALHNREDTDVQKIYLRGFIKKFKKFKRNKHIQETKDLLELIERLERYVGLD